MLGSSWVAPELAASQGGLSSKRKYLLTYLLMELSPSWGEAKSTATQDFPSILWNPNVHYISWARSVKSIPSQPISLRSILTFPPTYVLVFPVVSFLLAFPPISYKSEYFVALSQEQNSSLSVLSLSTDICQFIPYWNIFAAISPFVLLSKHCVIQNLPVCEGKAFPSLFLLLTIFWGRLLVTQVRLMNSYFISVIENMNRTSQLSSFFLYSTCAMICASSVLVRPFAWRIWRFVRPYPLYICSRLLCRHIPGSEHDPAESACRRVA
jgi:hypothetical protein